MYEELDRPEQVIVDPRSRFLVEDGEGILRMGEFNQYGDPAFSAAIREVPAVVECRVVPDGSCEPDEHPRFGTVSEIVQVGPRDATVLASYRDSRAGSPVSREWVIQLRFRSGTWRVARVSDGAVVGVPAGR